MKTYTYKIIIVYHGSTMADWELNEAGREGFKIAAQTPLHNVSYNEAGDTKVTPVGTQLIMEKEIEDQNAE